jgi:hypothetical protein
MPAMLIIGLLSLAVMAYSVGALRFVRRRTKRSDYYLDWRM